jgi:hypothetical protein
MKFKTGILQAEELGLSADSFGAPSSLPSHNFS